MPFTVLPQYPAAQRYPDTRRSDFWGGIAGGVDKSTDMLIQALLSGQLARQQTPGQYTAPGGQSTPISPAETGLIQQLGQNLPPGASFTPPSSRMQYQPPLAYPLQQAQLAKTQAEVSTLPLQREQLEADVDLKRAQAQEFRLKPDKEAAKQRRANLVDSTKIREEFLNRPEVKEYVTINTQVRSMDSLLQKAKEGGLKNKVSLDQALVTLFNKLSDPVSVVRESEYARTAANVPLFNRFSGAIQKMQQGGAGLTDSDREALVWGAKVIANERGRQFNETRGQYVDLSNKYDIEESLITRGLEPHSEYDVTVPGAVTVPGTTNAAISPKAQSIVDRYRGR